MHSSNVAATGQHLLGIFHNMLHNHCKKLWRPKSPNMTWALLPYLDFVFRKEEGGSACTPVLHKSGVGNHLIVHSGKCNGGQEIITQLYQSAACESGSVSDKQPACAWGPPACPGLNHPSMNNDIPSSPGALRMRQRSTNLRDIFRRRNTS